MFFFFEASLLTTGGSAALRRGDLVAESDWLQDTAPFNLKLFSSPGCLRPLHRGLLAAAGCRFSLCNTDGKFSGREIIAYSGHTFRLMLLMRHPWGHFIYQSPSAATYSPSNISTSLGITRWASGSLPYLTECGWEDSPPAQRNKHSARFISFQSKFA